MGSCLSKQLPYQESVPVTRLPDPCLIALFKQLPPADQVTAHKVCRRWSDLVTYAARSTRSLAILVGDNAMENFAVGFNIDSPGCEKVVSLLKKEDGSPMFPVTRFNEWNALLYREGLEEQIPVQAIVATFVNLDTLQIGLHRATTFQLDAISRLLEQWTDQLTTLKVSENLDFWLSGDRSVKRFFTAIKRLTTLKHLHMITLHGLPVTSKLERMFIYCHERSPRHFAALLRQHATPNTSLPRIEYICEYPHSAIGHVTSLSDHLHSRITRFGCPHFPLTNSQLISTHFRQLISLNLEPTDITLHRLFDHLSQLTQLLYLRLHINFESLLPEDQPHLLLPQLKSVKALRLDARIRSHYELEQLKISWTMPNIEAIEFYFSLHSQCTDCNLEEFIAYHLRDNLATAQNCFRQMFLHLKVNCGQLRAILHNREYILGTAEELLEE